MAVIDRRYRQTFREFAPEIWPFAEMFPPLVKIIPLFVKFSTRRVNLIHPFIQTFKSVSGIVLNFSLPIGLIRNYCDKDW